jgi:hypothetical protein
MFGEELAHHPNAFFVLEYLHLEPPARNEFSAPLNVTFSLITTRRIAVMNDASLLHPLIVAAPDDPPAANQHRLN